MNKDLSIKQEVICGNVESCSTFPHSHRHGGGGCDGLRKGNKLS
ncbi:MAG: hypothetical protein NTX75_01430 [Proteobacteria bacterium]|nr:hypothetical protein [Pseudomonadota bacterium]